MLSVQEMLDLVCWDRRYVVVPDEIASPERGRSVFLLDPKSADRLAALQAKRKCQTDCEQQGVPTEEKLLGEYKEAGYWTEEDDVVRKEAEDHIEFLEKKLRDEKMVVRQRNFKKQIEETRKKLADTEDKYRSIHTNTQEYLVRETELLTLVSRLTVSAETDRYLWPSEEEFIRDREGYGNYVMYLMHKLAEEIDLSVAEYRQLARSGEWRLIWTLSKENLSSLFNRPIQDLSSRQKLLIYWSRVYDSVYDDYERPDENIIEDDDLLDEWLANRSVQQEEKRTGVKAGEVDRLSKHNERVGFLDGYHIEDCTCGALAKRGKGLGESQVHDAGCKWGTWQAYTEEEKAELARRFYGRNNDHIRAHLNREHDMVAQSGTIDEQHLRGKKARTLLGQESKVFSKSTGIT